MCKDFLSKVDCTGLIQADIIDFGRYIYLYKQCIGPYYGHFDWDNEDFKQLCKINKIQPKGNKIIREQHNHFWFSSNKKDNKNDVAHHFLRHIRNAFAHGNIRIIKDGKSKSKYFEIKDFDIKHDGNIEQTMQGKIRCDLLWVMVNVLFGTFSK